MHLDLTSTNNEAEFGGPRNLSEFRNLLKLTKLPAVGKVMRMKNSLRSALTFTKLAAVISVT